MKKLLAMLLISVLMVSLFVGCSSNTSGSNPTDKPTQEPAGSSTGNDNPGDSSSAPEEQDNELYTFKMFANFTPAEQSEADKSFFAAVEKANNVKIELEVPPATNYAERLQIMMAGGDYPEVVLFPGERDKILLDAVENGVVIPINQYLENAPNLMQYTYNISWDSLKFKGDDQIYGVPRTSIARADGYIVRKDWLDNLGMTIPEGGAVTKDEFVEILRAFTEDDPDGNGIDDTYGFAANSDAEGNMGPILTWPFGLNGWQKADKGPYEYMNLQFSKEHDNFKKALEFTRDLWAKGYIDPDWPVTKRETAIERFKQGINGVIGEFSGWVAQYITDMTPIFPDVELTYITGVKDDNGKVEGGSFGTGFWGLWTITSSAEKPERIISVFDWMLSDEGWPTVNYGPEGVTYNVEDGKMVATDLYAKYSWGRAILRRNNDPAFFIPLSTSEEMKPKLEKWLSTCIEQAIFSKDRGYRPPAADDPVYIDYQKTMNQAISKIIVGERPVSDWDQILDEWYKNGGEAYIQQVNDFIKSVEGQ
ncbi:MAG TPA: extracellular solute-binding protein [Clostridiales bacterium]|nr:extracellular solute-binding protein [Clostridiales bacterium]